MRIAAFTGGFDISSRRFRIFQYIDYLAKYGIEIDEYVSKCGSWPPPEYWLRPLWLLGAIAERVAPVFRSHNYNLTLFQREFVSTLFTLERFAGRPRILDVDDAVWLINKRSFNNFKALVNSCDGVICGNRYIENNVKIWNNNTIVIPTAVDTDRFKPDYCSDRAKRIIGWSGLHAGSKYLLDIEEALCCVLDRRPNVVFRVVSDAPPAFRFLNKERVEFIRWSPENEVRTIQEMDIGLMPIDDSEWSKGKCSYKMLLYMACGVPVVVSPVGMNAEVLAAGEIGFGPASQEEWTDRITALLDDEDLRSRLGRNARTVVEAEFSLKKIAPRLAEYLLSFRS